MKRSEKMTTIVFPELGFLTPTNHAPATNPQIAQAACLQEQFTGPIPARSERSMAETLAERLAEAGPDSPGPVFIP